MRPRIAFPSLVVAAALASCGYRPPRFADRPPIEHAGDDRPTGVPGVRVLQEHEYVAEAYMHWPVLDALDASRFPDAGDVNALDEVPRSSWFEPRAIGPAGLERAYSRDGPPVGPLRVLSERPATGASGLVVLDARGLRYELRLDSAERPEMRTAAEAIASRLVWAFGLRTPEVHVMRLRREELTVGPGDAHGRAARAALDAWLRPSRACEQGMCRASATRWPPGIDLGPAPIATTRQDDPNDRVDHRDRRTLRALGLLGAWLGIKHVGPRKTLDAYVGPPGAGHVEHFVAGLDDALGAAHAMREQGQGSAPADAGDDALLNLVSLGFAPDPVPGPAQRRWKALGAIEPGFDPARYRPDRPYAPLHRAQAADEYWAAKRIAGVHAAVLWEAVRAGRISDAGASAELVRILWARRWHALGHGFSRVTPLDVVRAQDWSLELVDRALECGAARAAGTDYVVGLLDPSGREIAAFVAPPPRSARWALGIAPGPARATDYLVVRVTARRDGMPLPRAAEVHLGIGASGIRLLGVRH